MTSVECAVATVVPTPSGFRSVWELRAGDEVFGSTGLPVTIAATVDMRIGPVLDLTFCDGARATVGAWQPWLARDAATGVQACYRSSDIAAHLLMPDGSPRWSIPLADPIQFADNGPPAVDPFTFGEELRGGLVESENELLPYLISATDVRRPVLLGLLAGKSHLPVSAPALAGAGLSSLVRSLGGVPVFARAGLRYRIGARFGGRRMIVAAEPIEHAPTVAITVESADGMYVIGGEFVLARGGAA